MPGATAPGVCFGLGLRRFLASGSSCKIQHSPILDSWGFAETYPRSGLLDLQGWRPDWRD